MLDNYKSERGVAMWAVVICPQCGEHVEVDVGQLADWVFCPYCREKVELTYDERVRLQREEHHEETPAPQYLGGGRLDSSFWLS